MKERKVNSEISNLSLLDIFGLSLLLTSSYYFVEFVNIVSVGSATKIVELGFLFTFSIIFFLILNEVFKFFKKKSNINLSYFLVYIFFTWIFVQTIQTFFYSSNYITLSYFITKVFFLYPDSEYEVYIRTIRFILPYIICFLIIYFFKKKVLKFLRFFTIFGFVFFLLIFIREINYTSSSNKAESATLKFDYEVSTINNSSKKRKVLWVLLDEFDPQLAFQDQKFLENFEILKSKSVFHKAMYMPAKQTIVSVPSQLMGIHPNGFDIQNRIYYMKDKKNNLHHYNFDNTIFGRLDRLGLKSNIFSSGVIPYCSIYFNFNRFEKCKEKHVQKLSVKQVFKRPMKENLKGIFFVFSPLSKIKSFFMLLSKNQESVYDIYQNEINDENILNEIDRIKKIKINEKLKSITDSDGMKTVYFSDVKKFLEDDTHFGFFHLMIPHLPADYAKTVFNEEPNGRLSSYILNLKLTDVLIKKINDLLKENNSKEIMVIYSSDHWFREKDPVEKNFSPSLFIAKILNDNSKVEISRKNGGIFITELIYKFFTKDINNHKEIDLFFKQKPFLKPCLMYECLNGKKRLRI